MTEPAHEPPQAPAASGESPGTGPSYRRTLRNRPFFLLWTAQVVSQSGDFIFQVALLWLVLELTGSAFAVGLVVTATVLPAVVLGPFLGVYVDRWDRKRTLVATNLVEGAVVAALSGLLLAGPVNLAGILAIVLLLGAGGTTVRVATYAYVPSVVAKEDLAPANGLLSVSGSFNQILGLSLGGIFVAVLGVRIPIEYDALSFFVAAALLLAIPALEGAAAPDLIRAAENFRSEFLEGLSFLRSHRFMLELIGVGMAVNFFGYGVVALFAPYAADVLHGGPALYGFLGSVLAVGSVIGAAGIGRVDTRRSAGRFLLAGGVATGALILALGVVAEVAPALALMFGFGVALAVTNVPISILVQAKTPGPLLGRVGGSFSALVGGTGPLGPVFAGWLAGRWSVGAVFVLSGAAIVVILGVGAAVMTALRDVEY